MRTTSGFALSGLIGSLDSYTVQAGDTLSSIADYEYGDESYYAALAKYNNISNPNVIYVGQVLSIPDESDLDDLIAGGSVPVPSSAAPVASGSGSGAPTSIVAKPAAPATATSNYVVYGISAVAAIAAAYLIARQAKKKEKSKKMKKKSALSGLDSVSPGAIIGVAIAAAIVGAGYYFLFYRPAASAATGIAPASIPAPITLATIKARTWTNPVGVVNTSILTGYNAQTGVVTQNDSHWMGKLIDANTIFWTKNTGETQFWYAS